MKNLEENYISAVIVVHDDAPALADKLKSLNSVLAGLFKYFEIIVVDNYSRDNTAEILESLHLPIVVVTLSRWHNCQSALTAGVELSIGDYVLEIPSISTGVDYGSIEELYRICQQGNDFVFLVPEKTRAASWLFYRLLNGYYKGQISEQFVSSMMTLSSRRGQNKTADAGTRIVNRNVTYLLTGLKCAMVKSTAVNNNRRGFRENFDLMTDTLIFHTDYIAVLAFRVAFMFLGVSLLAIAYSLAMFFTINTAPGWASTFILIATGFGALFALIAVICKYLSNLIKLQLPKNYTFSSMEKKEAQGDFRLFFC
jgi:glycosyltransferase involved in cell wall biosynthesis